MDLISLFCSRSKSISIHRRLFRNRRNKKYCPGIHCPLKLICPPAVIRKKGRWKTGRSTWRTASISAVSKEEKNKEGQGVRAGKTSAETGRDCQAERKARTTDRNGRGYGAQTEIGKGEVPGLEGAGASPFRCLFIFSLSLLRGSVRQEVNR